MGHPFNQTQKIEIQNLSAQRFVGTDIQKNLFYGRDIPTLRYEYTFEYKPVVPDYALHEYDLLTSGDFVQLYLDRPKFRAEPYYTIRGEPHDSPLMAPTPTGTINEITFNKPLLAPTQSGNLEPCVREVIWDTFKYVQSYVTDIDWDEPKVGCGWDGSMLGTITTKVYNNMGYMFETGQLYKGDHIPSQFDVDEFKEAAPNAATFFFYTGRYDGPSS
jgi:hypothetical protein